MLFHLYNKLIERLALDRNINIDPTLKVIEKDFKPDLMDNDEIAQYIKTMLVNSHEDWSGKMLRETIAYANMMSRTHLKSKINKKFHPVEIFKEIKELLDRSKSIIKEHEKEKDLLKDKISKLEIEMKKMEREAKFKLIQHQNLEKKFDDQFNRRQAKSKQNRGRFSSARRSDGDQEKINHVNEESQEENISLMEKIRRIKTLNPRFNQDEEFDEDDEENMFNKNHKQTEDFFIDSKRKLDKENKSRAKSAHPVKRLKEKNNSKETFLTNNQSRNNLQSAKTRDLKSASTRPGTAQLVYLRPKTSVTLFKYARRSITTNENITNNNVPRLETIKNLTEGISYKTKTVTPQSTQNPNFKKLEMSKNKDKLTRLASYQVLPSHSDGFHALVEHTNKMFLYKAKMKASVESLATGNIFKKFQNNMDNNFKKLEKVKKKADGFEHEIGQKIMSNLNGMIKQLEKKE
jgi:hypothetical protein